MSWLERVNTDLVIITGDEKRYTPIWKNATKEKEYNVTNFEFPNIPGTFVDRRQPKGAKYAVEFYFQGEDNIEQASEFEISADDPRHWHLIHPFYGDIRVQPTKLKFDNTKYNITKITGIIIETIIGAFPKGSNVPEDLVIETKDTTDFLFAQSYANSNKSPSASDIAVATQSTEVIASDTLKVITTDEESTNFRQLLGKANSDLINATSNPLQAMISVQETIAYPYLISQSVTLRIDTLVNQFDNTVTSIRNQNLADIVTSIKLYFESIAASLLTTLCGAAVTPLDDSDYGNREDVTNVIEIVLNSYNTYLTTLDDLQSDSAEEPNAFIPDADAGLALNNIINLTLGSLFEIALNSRQERTISLEKDSNLILLTHRFYGLDPEDNNINEFIRNNNIGLNEHLEIKKGREITYFV